jgi:hypothetical protein
MKVDALEVTVSRGAYIAVLLQQMCWETKLYELFPLFVPMFRTKRTMKKTVIKIFSILFSLRVIHC